MHQKKVISKTSLTNMSKSEKSAYFRHIFANNFFVCIFSNLFQRIRNQREILHFFISISNFWEKKFVLLLLALLCPFAVYYLRYAVRSFFTMSRISLADGKRAGQKVQRKIAVAVQNVKPLYFLSRSFEIINGKRP